MNRLRVTWNGGETTIDPGATVRIGRELDVDIRVENSNVSRRHAEISESPDGWVLRDLGSAQGSWVDGRRVEVVQVRGTVQVTLGREGRGEIFTLEADTAATPMGAAADVPGTVVVDGARGGMAPGPDDDGTVIVGDSRGQRPGGALRAVDDGETVITGDRLTIECAGRVHSFGPDQEVIVGRQVDNDVVSNNPTVSRRHARLSHDGSGWTLHDEGSARGTYVDGKRIVDCRLGGSTAVWLGDPVAGERLVVVTQGESARADVDGLRPWLVPAAVALAALAVAVVLIMVLAGPSGTGNDDDELARATVRLVVGEAVGSGTVIDAERGLLLTTAELVAPSAPGVALRRGVFDSELPERSRAIEVLVSSGAGRPAEPRFLGEVVAVDGYLDLAVLQITETVGGRIIESDGTELADLVAVTVGGDDPAPGDGIEVVGYAATGAASGAEFVDGLVSGIARDDRLASNEGMIELSVPVDTGKVGGPVVDGGGRIVGVARTSDDGSALEARPGGLATELIEAARSGDGYVSPWYRPVTTERVTQIEIVGGATRSGISFGCGASAAVAAGTTRIGVRFEFTGFTPDEHQDLLVEIGSATEVLGRWDLTDVHPFAWPSPDGCATVTVPLTRAVDGEELAGLSARFGLGPGYVEQS